MLNISSSNQFYPTRPIISCPNQTQNLVSTAIIKYHDSPSPTKNPKPIKSQDELFSNHARGIISEQSEIQLSADLIAQSFVRPNSNSLCFYTDDFRESIFIRKNNLARPEYVFWAKPNSAQPSSIGPLRNPNPRASSINRGAHSEIFHSHPSNSPSRHSHSSSLFTAAAR
jgi:hypothetical protein